MANCACHLAAFGFRALHGVDGGIETHARELYPRLAKRGFRVTVLSRSPYDDPATAKAADTAPGVTSRPLYAPRANGLEALVHSAIAAAYCIIRRPDVVHVHGIGPSLFIPVLRLFGLRVVMTHHGPDYDATKWGVMARAVLRTGEGLGVRYANAVIGVSHYIRHLIAEKYGVSAHTIYNGLPASRRVRPPTDHRLRDLADRQYVLMVGRLTPHKRVEDVIAAVASADIDLVVCGGGAEHDPYVRQLEDLAQQHRNVKLLGFVASDDLPWVYHHAVCTVMASSYEGMPLAVLEALTFGSPTLLSRIPAHLELELPTKQYFDLGDVDGIRNGIRRVRDEPPARGAVAASIDDRFDWDTIAGHTRAVVLGIAPSRAPTAKAQP